MKKWWAVLFLMTLSTSVNATNASGKITQIVAHHNSAGEAVIMFRVENSSPICPTSSAGGWAFYGNDDKGKAMYAMLLSAAAQGKSIGVVGSELCDVWSDRERPRYIYVNY